MSTKPSNIFLCDACNARAPSLLCGPCSANTRLVEELEDTNNERAQIIRDKNVEIVALNENIRNRSLVIDESNEIITSLKAELDTLKGQRLTVDGQGLLDERTEAVKQMEKDIGVLRGQLAAAEVITHNQARVINERVNGGDHAMADLRGMLADRDDEVIRLEGVISRIGGGVDVEDLLRQIDSLNFDLTGANTNLARVKGQLEATEDQVAEFNNENNRLAAELKGTRDGFTLAAKCIAEAMRSKGMR